MAASALVGVTTVAAPVVAPLAAGLVAADRRGAVMGTLLSGSIGGMLLARTFSGTLGERLGWRAPYLVAALLVLLLAAVPAFTVPDTTPPSHRSYPALLAEPLRLLRTEPALRRSCFFQATVFAGFSAVWTCVALLLIGPAYGMGAEAVGMLALVGGATMFCTPLAGRLVDGRGPGPVNLLCFSGVLVSAPLLALGASGGVRGLTALTLGVLLLDVATQSGTVANQARVFSVRPQARSRLNTAYMGCAYLGGSAGSWLGVRVHGMAGWPGVCALLALLAALPMARTAADARRRHRRRHRHHRRLPGSSPSERCPVDGRWCQPPTPRATTSPPGRAERKARPPTLTVHAVRSGSGGTVSSQPFAKGTRSVPPPETLTSEST